MSRDWPPLPPAASRAQHIAGLDEVGRGPLAGPVVAAAVILPPDFPVHLLDDSKKLPPARRQELASLIRSHAAVALASLPAPDIDRLNILQASLLTMKRALIALPMTPDFALIDGNKVPKGIPCSAEAVVKGDARVACIAAASIIAKVARDAMMAEAAVHYPGYGFERHMGYPAKAHLAALSKLGLTPIHRLSYAPCRAIAERC
ncbi:MAG: ribonuclease HII [Rhizobiales bacterium]|nr:ribonuclease HII [Hyphomicrobiales bacterium]